MSSKDYYERWLKTKEKINVALLEDARIQQFAKEFVGVKPQATALEIVARTYAKYCDLYNQLCDFYDQMIQPQRAEYIKELIDAVTCRLLELKLTLEEIEAFEYTYPDNALVQMLIVPQDIEIMCPFFYPFEIRSEENQYIIDQIFAGNRLGDPEPTPSELERLEEARLEEERIRLEEKEAEIKRKLAMGEEIVESVASIVYTPEELAEMKRQKDFETHLNNIQRMERGRIETFRKIQSKNEKTNLYLELAGLKAPQARKEIRDRAANFIQKFYRAFMIAKREHEKTIRLKKKLGMIMTAYNPPSQKIQLEKVKEVRRQFRREYFKKWGETHLKEKARVFRLREKDILEDISDEVRNWFREFYDAVKAFDEYPWPEEGGSILVVKGETFTVGEYAEWEQAERRRLKILENNPKTPEDIKAEKRAEAEEKKRLALEAKEKEKRKYAEHKKMRQNPENDPGIWIMIGKYSDAVRQAWEKYQNMWNQIDIPEATRDAFKGYIMQIITENVYQEINIQLRPIVDEMMRVELGILRAALKYDNEIAKIKMPLAKKRKRPKKPKPPKIEKTPPERLFQRAVDSGIVVKYPQTTLDDFWGERNYAAADSRMIPWTPVFPPPCLGDVRDQIRARTILTLGSSCKNAVRSQLLVGPKGCGKRTLVYAVATETNSILIDLSPKNVYNKFPGNKGLKQMLGLVNKVSRIMQPTVIFIRDADKLFYKKVPKEEKEFDPTRMSRDFFKEIVKGIKAEDKILVLGTATEPWLSKGKELGRAFKATILMPCSDYASVSFILTKILMQYHGIDREFDVHSLAQAIRGYDINSIRRAIERVLHGNRVAELTYKPLQPIEIVNAVVEDENAVYTDAWDSEVYKKWYLSYSPWGKNYEEYMLIVSKQLDYKIRMDAKKKKKT